MLSQNEHTATTRNDFGLLEELNRSFLNETRSYHQINHDMTVGVSPDLQPLPDLIKSFDLDPNVVRWTLRPKSILGRLEGVGVVSHVPDIEVHFLDGSVAAVDAFGIVGFEPIDPSLRYLDASVERPIDAASRRNLRGIIDHVDLGCSAGDQLRVLAHLYRNEESTLVEVAATVTDSRDPISTVVAMAARKIIYLDWQNGPITASSVVRVRPKLMHVEAPDPCPTLPVV